MLKKLAVASIGIALAAIAWWLSRPQPTAPEGTPGAQAPSTRPGPRTPDPSVPSPTLAGSEGSTESAARAVASPSPAPFGSLDLEWTWKDGTPAANLGVGAVFVDAAGQWGRQLFAPTDPNGRVTFEHLPPGQLLIQIDRGCSSEAWKSWVRAGERTFARFTVRAGVDVRGRVLDPEGRPAAGAVVWLARSGNGGGSPVARSAEDGSYEVRDVDRTCGVFATRAGFGASAHEPLRDRPPAEDGKLLLDLQLRGEGGDLTGFVRDAEGRPLANAWLVAHCRGGQQGREFVEWPCPWTATDPEGSFRFEGLHAGLVRVPVDLEGFATVIASTTVVAGTTVRLDVTLEEGCAVEGVVRTADGAPAKGTRISQGPRAGSPDWVYHRLASAVADDQGRFRLSPVPSGPVELWADLRTKADVGHAATSVNGRTGETLAWNPVLERNLEIRGRLVDESGDPIAGWRIEAGTSAEIDSPPNGVDTDAEGRFLLRGCADVPFRVQAFPPREPGQKSRPATGASADEVRPGQGELVLTVTRAGRPSAFLLGKVVDELGKPFGGATIHAGARLLRAGTMTATAPEDGAFRIGPLPAGQWELTVIRKDVPSFQIGEFPLAPDEERDLGTIALRSRGRFELLLLREDGARVANPVVLLRDGLTFYGLETADGSTFESEELYAGTYLLCPDGSNVASRTSKVEIRGGATTKLEFRLPAGVMQLFTFRAPELEPIPEVLQGVIRSTDGRISVEIVTWASPTSDGKRSLDFSVGLGPGSYVLTAESEDGWSAEASFEVAATESAPKTVEARLVRAR